jgi:formyltetrahydrofolate deformylase
VLRVLCPDRPGLVADVANLLFRLGANILHADDHIDHEANTFFQRVAFALPLDTTATERVRLQELIGRTCEGWGMRWSLRFSDQPRKMALLVSKQGHCALDLLARHRSGELACEIPVVVSNHPDLGDEIARMGYRFVHEPIVEGNKAAQEDKVLAHLRDSGAELVVLARYMQILSPRFVESWREKVVNIHHSFLPAFAGAEPYRQAYRRGVKLIGATSHFVTEELDEGPIIAQEVARVSHRDAVEDMVRKGRDLERLVLANAIRCLLEDRIIAYGNKTVVFE